MDKPELEVYTWYMTKKNYRDMRKGKPTKVIVPLFETRYQLYIYSSLGNSNNWTCSIQSPGLFSSSFLRPAYDNDGLDLLRYAVVADKSNSGVYSVTCLSIFRDKIRNLSHSLSVTKSLNIAFIRGILLYVAVKPPNKRTLIRSQTL